MGRAWRAWPLVGVLVIGSMANATAGRAQPSSVIQRPPARLPASAAPPAPTSPAAPADAGSGADVTFGVGIALAAVGLATIPIGAVVVADADTTCDFANFGGDCEEHMEVPVLGVVLAAHGLGAIVTGIALAIIHAPDSSTRSSISWDVTVGSTGAMATWKF